MTKAERTVDRINREIRVLRSDIDRLDDGTFAGTQEDRDRFETRYLGEILGLRTAKNIVANTMDVADIDD